MAPTGGGEWCSGIQCSNSRKKCPEISFFRFPTDTQRCMKWVVNSRREDLLGKPVEKLHRGNVLCANHFEETQFMNRQDRKRLIWNAIPTLFAMPNPPPGVTCKRKAPAKREPPCTNKIGHSKINEQVDPTFHSSGNEEVVELPCVNKEKTEDTLQVKKPPPGVTCKSKASATREPPCPSRIERSRVNEQVDLKATTFHSSGNEEVVDLPCGNKEKTEDTSQVKKPPPGVTCKRKAPATREPPCPSKIECSKVNEQVDPKATIFHSSGNEEELPCGNKEKTRDTSQVKKPPPGVTCKGKAPATREPPLVLKLPIFGRAQRPVVFMVRPSVLVDPKATTFHSSGNGEVVELPCGNKEKTDNTSQVKKLKQIVKNQKSKIYRLEQKIRLLKTGLKKDKPRVRDIIAATENILPTHMHSFFSNQLILASKGKKWLKWKEADKRFALSLFRSSPEAYRMLRKLFNLPSEKCLRRSISNVDVEAGKISSGLSVFAQKKK